MQKSTHSFIVISFLFLVFCFSATAQTNVSGGIYANTTWTLANSPYIVVDTVVVFPGVTLTIQPGVTVKFKNNQYLEIRQSTLIALGTAVDSITFTSDSLVPHPGIWKGIIFNDPTAIQTDYCVYKYASNALNFGTINFNVTIQHSAFYNNTNCIPQNYNPTIVRLSSFYNNGLGIGLVSQGCTIDSCIFINNILAADVGSISIVMNNIFINNQTGLGLEPGAPQYSYLIKQCIFCNNKTACNNGSEGVDSLINCNFSENHIALKQALCHYMSGNIFTNNDTAIFAYYTIDSTYTMLGNYIYHNQVGLLFNGGDAINIINNKICNNTLYNLKYSSPSNAVLSNNCWCDTDSATIRSKIYDGYVNVALGLVNFSPYIHCDSSALATIQPINCQTVVIITDAEENANHLINGELEIFPNPASDQITLNLSKDISKAQFKIFNILGEMKYSSFISSQKTTIDISGLANGVYLIEVNTENNILRQKFIKQQLRQ